MPRVDPSVSALMTAALIGRTTEPNARNISSRVVLNSRVSINGALANRLWIESCSKAGVPPTSTLTPLGGVIERSSPIFWAASLLLIRPFWMTRTLLSFGWVPLGPSTQGFPATSGQGRSSHWGLVNPETLEIWLRMSLTCWSVTGLWLSF